MKGQENKHTEAFRSSKLKPGERVELHLEGWIGDVMGSGKKAQHNGQFILTSERACFHRKAWLGDVFETMLLDKITSVETRSSMGFRVLRVHTPHDQLEFKTFEDKPLFEAVCERLEALRSPAQTPKQSSASPLEQIRSLAELRDAGVLTEEEFAAKKVQLLDRL